MMAAESEDLPETGLVEKFEVKRLRESSRGIDHTDCRYFVLDPRHDPIARVVIDRYASLAVQEGQLELAHDLNNWMSLIDRDIALTRQTLAALKDPTPWEEKT